MSDTERNTLLHLVKLIMSSKPPEEQQKEALQCLKSNPEVLLSLIKRSCDKEDNDPGSRAPENSDSRSMLLSPKCLPQGTDIVNTYQDVEEISKARLSRHSKFSTEQRMDQSQQNVSNQTTSSEISPSDKMSSENTTPTTSSEISPSDRVPLDNTTRKRRSKYSHIQGDLSHIERDPKRKRVSQDIKTRKYSRLYKNDKETVKGKETGKFNEQDNIHLVRSLIEMLKYPKSRQHQDCIIALLRTDDNLRRLFLEEKAKLGKQVVHVFRRSTLSDETQSFPAVHANQSPPTTTDPAYSVQEEVHGSSLNSPSNISSGLTLANDDLSSSDDLIHAILNTMNSGDVETQQDHQRGTQTDEMSMHIPFTGFHAQGSRSITNMQNDFSETNDPLYFPLGGSRELNEHCDVFRLWH